MTDNSSSAEVAGITCESGNTVECGSWDSGLVCDSGTRRCVDAEGAEVERQPRQPGLAVSPLHPIIKAVHAPDADNRTLEQLSISDLEELVDYSQLEAINEANTALQEGVINKQAWTARTFHLYRNLVIEKVAAPVAVFERKNLDDAVYQVFRLQETGQLKILATQIAEQWRQAEAAQERLKMVDAIAGSIENRYMLDWCTEVFESHDFLPDEFGDPRVRACTSVYSKLIDILEMINDRGIVPDKELKSLRADVMLAETAAVTGVDSQAARAKYLHILDLPYAIRTYTDLLLLPELKATALFAAARHEVSLEGTPSQQPFKTTGRFAETLPLGQWAQIWVDCELSRLSICDSLPENIREMLFGEALGKTLEDFRGEVNTFLEELDQEFPRERLWELALIADYTGLMQLYGGYDEAANPQGFQAVHDLLLSEAHQKEFAAPGMALASSGVCGTLSVAALLGASIPGLLPVAVCAVAAVVGVYQYQQLATLASAMQRMAFFGLESSLVSPLEAKRLQRDADLAAVVTIIDVLFTIGDVAFSASEIARLTAKAMGWAEATSDTALRLLRTRAKLRIPLLRRIYGALEVTGASELDRWRAATSRIHKLGLNGREAFAGWSSRTPIRFGWEFETRTKSITQWFAPYWAREFEWLALSDDIRWSQLDIDVIDVHDTELPTRLTAIAPSHLQPGLSIEAPGLAEIRSEPIAFIDELVPQFQRNEGLSGGYHLHITAPVPQDAQVLERLARLVVLTDEYIMLRHYAGNMGSILESSLFPIDRGIVRNNVERLASGIPMVDIKGWVGWRSGRTYGDDSILGIAIRGLSSTPERQLPVAAEVTATLEDLSRQIRFGTNAPGIRLDDASSLFPADWRSGISGDTLQRVLNVGSVLESDFDNKQLLHTMLVALSNITTNEDLLLQRAHAILTAADTISWTRGIFDWSLLERWLIPFWKWENRPWLASMRGQIDLHRQTYLTSLIDIADAIAEGRTVGGRVMDPRRGALAISLALHDWAKSLALHHLY